MICNCGSELVMLASGNETIGGLCCLVAFAAIENGTRSQEDSFRHYYSSDIHDIRRHLQDIVNEYLAEQVICEVALRFLTYGTLEYKYVYNRFRCAKSAAKLNAERLKLMEEES